jgi:zinc protease
MNRITISSLFAGVGFALAPLGLLAALLAPTPVLAAPASSAAQSERASKNAGLALHPAHLTFEPLEFEQELPEPLRLSNGVMLYMISEPSWGTVTLTGYIPAGSVHDPAGKVGLAEAVGDLMLEGGAGSRDGDALAEFLDERAMMLGARVSDDFFTFSFDALPDTLDEALPVLRDFLVNPRFEAQELERWRRRQIEQLRRRNDSPEGIAGREFSQLVQGKTNPWARTATPSDIMAIEREDLVRWHADYVRPNRALIGIVGDFDPATMPARLEKLLSDWEPRDAALPAVEPLTEPKPGVYYVNRPGQPNTQIYMGHLGLRRHSPDQIASEAINELYGEGFSSRLMREVRDNRGLSYGAQGRLGFATDRGVFINAAATQAPRTAEAVQVIVEEIRKLAEGPVSEEELQRAVDAISNSFVFRYATPGSVANWALSFEMRGYPKDYHKTYLPKLRALTPEEVASAAHRNIHPDKLVILLVGDASVFLESVRALGYGEPQEIVPDDYSAFQMPEAQEAENGDGNGRPVVPVRVPAGS